MKPTIRSEIAEPHEMKTIVAFGPIAKSVDEIVTSRPDKVRRWTVNRRYDDLLVGPSLKVVRSNADLGRSNVTTVKLGL